MPEGQTQQPATAAEQPSGMSEMQYSYNGKSYDFHLLNGKPAFVTIDDQLIGLVNSSNGNYKVSGAPQLEAVASEATAALQDAVANKKLPPPPAPPAVAQSPIEKQGAPSANAPPPEITRDSNGIVHVHYKDYPNPGKTADFTLQVSPIDGTAQAYSMDINEAATGARTIVSGRIIEGKMGISQITAMQGEKIVESVIPNQSGATQKTPAIDNFQAITGKAFTAANKYNSEHPWKAQSQANHGMMKGGLMPNLTDSQTQASASPQTPADHWGGTMQVLNDGTFRFTDAKNGWVVDDKFEGTRYHEVATNSRTGGKVEVVGEAVNGELAINRIRIDENIRQNGQTFNVHNTLDHDTFLTIVNRQAKTTPDGKLTDAAGKPLKDADTGQQLDAICLRYPDGVLANANRAIRALNEGDGHQLQQNGPAQPAGHTNTTVPPGAAAQLQQPVELNYDSRALALAHSSFGSAMSGESYWNRPQQQVASQAAPVPRQMQQNNFAKP